MLPIKNSKGLVLRVPKTTLEAKGFHPAIDGGRELIKLQVAWSSPGEGRLEDVFANYYPRDRRAEVYLGRLGGRDAGFGIAGAKRYGSADFAEDFNGKRPVNLQNVNLEADDGAVWIDIDGRRIALSECLMSTFGSMVNLRGKLSTGGPELKFEYDGKSAAARFKGRMMIEFMQVQGEELEIRYAQSKDERHLYRMELKGR